MTNKGALILPVLLMMVVLPFVQGQACARTQDTSRSAKMAKLNKVQHNPGQTITGYQDQYLLAMRRLIGRYQQIAINLLMSGFTKTQNSGDVSLSAIDLEVLIQELNKISSPTDVAEMHKQFTKSLEPVLKLVKATGTTKQEFHKVVSLMKQVQDVFDSYHNAVLAMMQAQGIPASQDPFSGTTIISPKRSTTQKQSTVGTMSSGFPNLPPDGMRLPDENNVVISPSSLPSFVNGVDGTLGMSGLFNGLAGTGTNGLVDGLGVSTGLNGWGNGISAPFGMSGMLNDTETSNP